MKNTQKPFGQHGKGSEHADKTAKGQRIEGGTRAENKSDPAAAGRNPSAQHRPDEPGKMHAPERDAK